MSNTAKVILGVHSMCFVGEFRRKDLPLLDWCYKAGARILEIVPFNYKTFPAEAVKQAAADVGIRISIGFGLPQWADPASLDEGTRQKSYDLSRYLIDKALEAGSRYLTGAIHNRWGKPSAPTADAWKHAVESMIRVASYAELADRKFRIGVENINRFEVGMLNTGADVLRFVREVDMSNVGVHWDFFHAHIEEDDPIAALRKIGRHLFYVHANESHRGQPGKGQVPWLDYFKVLKAMGYRGPVVLESFNPDMKNVAGPTATWRRMAKSQESLVRQGLMYIRQVCSVANLEMEQ